MSHNTVKSSAALQQKHQLSSWMRYDGVFNCSTSSLVQPGGKESLYCILKTDCKKPQVEDCFPELILWKRQPAQVRTILLPSPVRHLKAAGISRTRNKDKIFLLAADQGQKLKEHDLTGCFIPTLQRKKKRERGSEPQITVEAASICLSVPHSQIMKTAIHV